MSYAVRPSLLHCDLVDVIILLDLQSCRYRMLTGGAADALRAFLVGEHSPQQLSWLINQHIVELGAAAGPLFHQVSPLPTASIYDDAAHAARPLLIVHALVAQRSACRTIKRVPLLNILQALDARLKAVDEPNLLFRGEQVAQAFRRSWRWAPQLDACLPRGIAMASMLASLVQPAQLVIGVMLPFAAHCWVQSGSTVLTDPVEKVRSYTPILVVG